MFFQVSGRFKLSRVWVTEGKITVNCVKETQAKLTLVRVSGRFELSRVNCISLKRFHSFLQFCISLDINQCHYWPVNNCFGKSMTNQGTLLKCNYLWFVVSQFYSKHCKKHDNPTFLKGYPKNHFKCMFIDC